MKLWKWEPENLPSVKHSARTAVAATMSFMIARLFRLPEAYWAAIATLVVMQSTLGATLVISVECIAATAFGALVGALLAMYFGQNLLVFAAAIFVIGLLCVAFRMERSAYRYASITLAIIVLIPRSNAGSSRFIASLKSRLESSSLWPWQPRGQSSNPVRRSRAASKTALCLAQAIRLTKATRPREIISADANNASLVATARSDLGQFSSLQSSCED